MRNRKLTRFGNRSQQRMPIQILGSAKDSVTSLAIKNHIIVAGSVDGKARTYDVRMGELREDFFDRASLSSLFLLPNSPFEIQIDLMTSFTTEPITSTTLSADASLLLLATLDSKVHLIDLDSGMQLQSFEGHRNTDYRSKAGFGKGEKEVVMGDEDGKLWVWDVESVGPPSFWAVAEES